MALSQKHRNVLFEYLSPRVGEETAEALMAEFPAREGDELVTKEFLRAGLADLRNEVLSGEVLATKEFLRAELAALRKELVEGDVLVTETHLRAELAELKSDLTLRMVSVVAVATGVIVAFGR